MLSGSDPLHALARADDGNARIVAQRQQITPVTRGNEVGCAGQGCWQHVVVIGVGGHHARHVCRRDHDGKLAQVIHENLRAQAGLNYAISELAVTEQIEQLGQKDFARAQLEIAGTRCIQELAWQPAKHENRGEQVGVDDEAHGAWASGALAPNLTRGLHLLLDLFLGQRRQIQ